MQIVLTQSMKAQELVKGYKMRFQSDTSDIH